MTEFRRSSDILQFIPRGSFGLWAGNFEEDYNPHALKRDSLSAYSNEYGRFIAAYNNTISVYSFPPMEEYLHGSDTAINLFEDREVAEKLLVNEISFENTVDFLCISKSEKYLAVVLKESNELVVFDLTTFANKVMC